MRTGLLDAPPLAQVLERVAALRADVVAEAAERRQDWVRRYGDGPRRVDLANLAAYVAMRRHDLRQLQDDLSALGLSSLGRNEAHVLAGVDAVLTALRRMSGSGGGAGDGAGGGVPGSVPAARAAARQAIEAARDELFGVPVGSRRTRILVTLPTAAAESDEFVTGLIRSGADSVRINTAHDGPEVWSALVARTRAAADAAGRRVPVLVDLAGPKLRVGPIEPGPPTVRLRVRRDAWGQVVEPARVVLDGSGAPGGPGRLAVDAAWLGRVEVGDELRTRDLAGRRRTLRVLARVDGVVHAECGRSCYLAEGSELARFRHGRDLADVTRVGTVAASPGEFRLRVGDHVLMTRSGAPGAAVARGPGGVELSPARISCAEPGAVDQLEVGHRVLLDDGRLEGVVRRTDRDGATVEVVRAPTRGLRVREGRGINLPDTELDLPMLSGSDRVALRTVVGHADAVGCSFVRTGEEMAYLTGVLGGRRSGPLGLVVKVETESAVFHLPDILASVTGSHPLGVMIARGDLAVELGWARLAEYQRRILWFCEAAHVPVVWATQVLESMVRTGIPSRAELTDASEAERADCVMLNKGDHLEAAVALLDSILVRMQDHVDHKRDLLPDLRHLG